MIEPTNPLHSLLDKLATAGWVIDPTQVSHQDGTAQINQEFTEIGKSKMMELYSLFSEIEKVRGPLSDAELSILKKYLTPLPISD